jgi:hypothetical protein
MESFATKLMESKIYQQKRKETCTQPLESAPPPRYLFAKSTSRASCSSSSIKPEENTY